VSAGTSAVLDVFAALSWEKIFMLASGAGAYLSKAVIDAILADRAAKRECSISYILSLDE
jgi:hypothetical protein